MCSQAGIVWLRGRTPSPVGKLLIEELQRLEEVRSGHMEPTIRPMTELSASALLTGAPGLPQLGREIERAR